jgi:hypothetical protein
MSAGVIGALIFMVYIIGIDAFCQWASDNVKYHPDFPNPDKE